MHLDAYNQSKELSLRPQTPNRINRKQDTHPRNISKIDCRKTCPAVCVTRPTEDAVLSLPLPCPVGPLHMPCHPHR